MHSAAHDTEPLARRRVVVVAHDVHDGGGMEKVTAQLLRAGAERWQWVVVSATLAPELRPLVEWHRVRVPSRPFPLRFVLFFVVAGVRLRRVRAEIRHTCGAIVPNRVDVASVHFCHAAYAEVERADRRRVDARGLNTAITRVLSILAERWCYRPRRLGTLAAVSGGIADELQRHYPDVPVVVTPNGVDAARFAPDPEARRALRAAEQVGDDDVVVLFVGGDWLRKGVPELVAALARTSTPAARLWVVGGGDQSEVERQAAQLGVADRVRCFGRRDDTPAFYAAADVFALPSRYEAAPLVVLEAAAAGLAIVATAVNGATDVVADGETGLIVDRAPASIAAAIDRLVAEPDLRAHLGAAVRERALGLTWQRSYETVAGVYEAAA